jgi:hypothetical protein
MGMWKEYTGKLVAVVQTDGYRKFGVLEEGNDSFIGLRFLDGRLEIISAKSIKTINLSNRNRDGDGDTR